MAHDPYIHFMYPDGRVVYGACSTAHRFIVEEDAQPSTSEDREVYAAWCESEGLDPEASVETPAPEPEPEEEAPESEAPEEADVDDDEESDDEPEEVIDPESLIRHTSGGWYEVEGLDKKVQGKDEALEAAREVLAQEGD